MKPTNAKRRPEGERAAVSSAAAKPLNKVKFSASARVVADATTRLPASLERRLADLEQRVAVVEQLTICPMACRGEGCATACPTGEAVTV